MASLKQYQADIRTVLAQCEQAMTTSDLARQIFLESYTLALDDLKATWETNPVWGQDIGNNDFSVHVARIRAVLEQRLTGETEPRAMTAGASATGMPQHASGTREGGP